MVVSETSKPERRRDPRVTSWLAAHGEERFYISTVTIAELSKGIALCRGRDPLQAQRLGAWLEDVLDRFAERLLPVDLRIARLWGEVSSRPGAPPIESFVAATALAHGLPVVTRNERDFRLSGATVINPYEAKT